jgi:hypothetical protein
MPEETDGSGGYAEEEDKSNKQIRQKKRQNQDTHIRILDKSNKQIRQKKRQNQDTHIRIFCVTIKQEHRK